MRGVPLHPLIKAKEIEGIKQKFYKFFTIWSYIKYFFCCIAEPLHIENWMLASLQYGVLDYMDPDVPCPQEGIWTWSLTHPGMVK